MADLLVSEIFCSIQGESSWAGYPCTFVRLSGCNLRCAYCDTQYAWEGGSSLSVDAVFEEVTIRGLRTVELTGGEPLLQSGSSALLDRLCRANYRVLLETNGSLPLDSVPSPVHVVMDLKTPGSRMAEEIRWENLKSLKPTDEVKLVLTGRGDYDWALETLAAHDLLGRARISFSPCAGLLDPTLLASWMLDDGVDVRLQLQLHRVLWPGRERGV